MEQELFLKEQQLVEITKKQDDLERKLIHINLNETETKNDNDRLHKVWIKVCLEIRKILFFEEKIELEEKLQEIMKDLEESKHYISQLQIQTKKDKRDRAK
jgi:hypothetical protein